MSEHTRMALARAKAADMDAERDALDEEYQWSMQQSAIDNHYNKFGPASW